jgi:hypothetical protein
MNIEAADMLWKAAEQSRGWWQLRSSRVTPAVIVTCQQSKLPRAHCHTHVLIHLLRLSLVPGTSNIRMALWISQRPVWTAGQTEP